jgi:hypothetical protein
VLDSFWGDWERVHAQFPFVPAKAETQVSHKDGCPCARPSINRWSRPARDRVPAFAGTNGTGRAAQRQHKTGLNRLTLVLMVACLAGCSAYNRGVANFVLRLSPAVPPDLIDKTDGVYKGVRQPVLAGSPTCPTAREGTVEIGDSTLFFAFTPSTIFITPVQPDGTVLTVLPEAKLDGRLTDGRLQFLVADPVCQTRYDLRRVL